ncbi:MAG: tetratricopeptide repeat protein [Nitrosomonas sp.]|nr:tetratricopeptide repeat protein [Nitrosomonas sp.]
MLHLLPGFTQIYGEMHHAAGKTDEARAAYQKALDSLNAQGAYRNVIQMKLDVLRNNGSDQQHFVIGSDFTFHNGYCRTLRVCMLR